jgi:hypothetical protein
MVGLTEALLALDDEAIAFFTCRDLLHQKRLDVRKLWQLPAALRILRRQQPDGSWRYAGGRPAEEYGVEYEQIETFRQLGFLVELYGFDRRHEAVERAAEYLFRCQTSQGDFRGVNGSQYVPHFSGVLTALLARAGYAADPRLENSYQWLLYMRQQDGGWVFPFRTAGLTYYEAMPRRPIEPDRTRPFSHLITGMVLRAFAAHPARRRSEPARHAARLLASRFFQQDCYPDRRAPSNWRRPSFPFWYTDAVSALDSLTLIGIPPDHPGVAKALAWIESRRRPDGLYHFDLLRNKSVPNLDGWLTLAVARRNFGDSRRNS